MAAEGAALSRASDLKVVVLRGRFQPFTRIHYECVREFYRQHYKEGSHLLIIGVVRDIEALATELPPECNISVASEGNDYRHLPLFNPMRFADCAERIKEDIEYWASKEKQLDDGQRPQFQEFCRKNVIVNLLPFKVEHLFKGMFTPSRSFDNYLFPILEAFKPAREKNGPLLNPGRGLAAALVQLAFEQLRATYESATTGLEWLWPVIDREDLSTFEDTLKKHTPDQVFPCFIPREKYNDFVFEPKYESFRGAGNLSIYGTFMYWALLKLTSHDPTAMNVSSEIERVREQCKHFVTPETLATFERKMRARAKTIYDETERTKNARIKRVSDRYQQAYTPDEFRKAARLYLKPLESSELTRLASVEDAINIGTMEQVGRISPDDISLVLDKVKKYEQTASPEHKELLDIVAEIAKKLQKKDGKYLVSNSGWQVVRKISENPDRDSWLRDIYQINKKELEDLLTGI